MTERGASRCSSNSLSREPIGRGLRFRPARVSCSSPRPVSLSSASSIVYQSERSR